MLSIVYSVIETASGQPYHVKCFSLNYTIKQYQWLNITFIPSLSITAVLNCFEWKFSITDELIEVDRPFLKAQLA